MSRQPNRLIVYLMGFALRWAWRQYARLPEEWRAYVRASLVEAGVPRGMVNSLRQSSHNPQAGARHGA